MSKQKTIWITGASSGIGQALAIQYNKDGYLTLLSGRNLTKLESIKSSLKYPEQSDIFAFDVNDFENAQYIISKLIEKHPLLDIVILNAGVSQRSSAETTTMEVTESILRTNFLSNVNIVKSIFETIKKSKSHLVVISSVTGKIGTPWRSSYAASKHALHGYFDSLRAELYDDNVNVTLVCPGYVNTNISLNALTGDGTPQQTMDTDTAKGLAPEDLAKKIKNGVASNKKELYIGGKEIIAIYLKRFFPSILANIIKNIRPK